MDENNKKSFINENILGRDITLQRAMKYALLSVLCGLLFGLTALGVVALSQKLGAKEAESAAVTVAETSPTEDSQEPQQSPESQRSDLPAAETTAETATETVTQTATEAAPEEAAEAEATPDESAQSSETDDTQPAAEEATLNEEAVRELVRQQLEEDEPAAEDLNALRSLQQTVVQQVSEYLVVVSTTLKETTWFESVVETERNFAGIILGKEEKEILILTVMGAATGKEDLYVTFDDGSRQKAVIRKEDTREGFVMLAVSTEGLGSKLTESIEAVSCYEGQLQAGQPVLTAGAPLDIVGSVDFGLINYIGETEPVIDGSRDPVYTKAASHPEKGTFLMTLTGQLIGIAQQPEETVDGNRFIRVTSVSGLLEEMKKGNDTAYLGIKGSDISFEMKTGNIPEGMLITEVEEGSPAEEAGIKYGDIITSIGSRQIKGLADYCSFLRNLKPGEEFVMVISRGERGTFQNMEISITAAGR